MRARALFVVCGALPLIGCTEATADSLSADNPFHCGIAMTVMHALATSQASPATKDFQARMHWQALKVATLPETERSRSEGAHLADRISADLPAALPIIMACMRKQDADPEFQKFFTAARA